MNNIPAYRSMDGNVYSVRHDGWRLINFDPVDMPKHDHSECTRRYCRQKFAELTMKMAAEKPVMEVE